MTSPPPPELPVVTLREHEGGPTEIVLDARGQSPADVAFALGRMTSHLEGATCEHCGAVWFGRTPGPLCPVCNPSHPGYDETESQNPERHARWLGIWRSELLSTLQRLGSHPAPRKRRALRLVERELEEDDFAAEPPEGMNASGNLWAPPPNSRHGSQPTQTSQGVRYLHRTVDGRPHLTSELLCGEPACDYCAVRTSSL